MSYTVMLIGQLFGLETKNMLVPGERPDRCENSPGETYGHELSVIERIRVQGKRLIYKHEITGPGGKSDEREITFEIGDK